MMLERLADYCHWYSGFAVTVHDGVFVPLRVVVGGHVAFFVADVVEGVFSWFLLEPVAFWIAERVIRERWAKEDAERGLS